MLLKLSFATGAAIIAVIAGFLIDWRFGTFLVLMFFLLAIKLMIDYLESH